MFASPSTRRKISRVDPRVSIGDNYSIRRTAFNLHARRRNARTRRLDLAAGTALKFAFALAGFTFDVSRGARFDDERRLRRHRRDRHKNAND